MLTYSKIICVFFCILATLSGCKKDPSIPPKNLGENCDELPSAPQGGWNYTTRNLNLNNLKSQSDLIYADKLYYLCDDSLNRYILWSLSRGTNIKSFIDSKIISSPILNKKEWITYSKSDFNIYKVKTNGDSLTKLTSNGASMNPVWDMTGNYIYYNDANNLSVYRMSKSGILVDTLKNVNSTVTLKDSLIIFLSNAGNSQSLYIKNYFTNSTKLLITQTLNHSNDLILGFFFDNSNTFVYYYDLNGLYKVNIDNYSKSKIISSCPKERRLHYSFNYLTNKIMATQISTTLINNYTLYNEYNLIEFNSDGSNPNIINTP